MPLSIEYLPLARLKPAKRTVRRHSKAQIRQLADSIKRFGFNNPLLIDDEGNVVVGQGRLAAAKLLNLKTAPVVRLSHLDGPALRAYAIADNRLGDLSTWDPELLALEMQELKDIGFEGLEVMGFATAEIDKLLADLEAGTAGGNDETDLIPPARGPAVTRPGDVWLMGGHRLICGDALKAETYRSLLEGVLAAMAFTDPPYNVRIDGHVGGAGKVKHREFAMAAGEMTKDQFQDFLATSLKAMADCCRDGAIVMVCMDWRHLPELLAAGEAAFDRWMNLIVWNKTNAGMGTFYRSKHELVLVYKVGEAPHTNTFGLGSTGRYRTNVWDYAGVNSFGAGRMDDLSMHPTVKPTALVADAIKDVTRRGDVVLDAFGGSGTTLIAAQMTGRQARLIELDPLYCDVIVRRWQAFTGRVATRASDGVTFEDAEQALVSLEAAQ